MAMDDDSTPTDSPGGYAGFDHHLVKPLDIDALMPILLALQQPV